MIEKGKDPKLESSAKQWGDQRFVSKPVTLYLGLLSLILGPTYLLAPSSGARRKSNVLL
jgi:hypothetical protein